MPQDQKRTRPFMSEIIDIFEGLKCDIFAVDRIQFISAYSQGS